MTILWAILIVFVLLILWLLLSPISIEIDSRVPLMIFRWTGIGKASLTYREKLQLDLWIFFYHKTLFFPFTKPKKERRLKAENRKRKAKKKMSFQKLLRKAKRVLHSFTVDRWELAVDTGDHTLNARLYPLNFLRPCFRHLFINFTGQNYLVVKIHNRPAKLIYAILR